MQQPIERTQNNQNHLKTVPQKKVSKITILKKGIIVWDIHQISLIQKCCYYESIIQVIVITKIQKCAYLNLVYFQILKTLQMNLKSSCDIS